MTVRCLEMLPWYFHRKELSVPHFVGFKLKVLVLRLCEISGQSAVRCCRAINSWIFCRDCGKSERSDLQDSCFAIARILPSCGLSRFCKTATPKFPSGCFPKSTLCAALFCRSLCASPTFQWPSLCVISDKSVRRFRVRVAGSSIKDCTNPAARLKAMLLSWTRGAPRDTFEQHVIDRSAVHLGFGGGGPVHCARPLQQQWWQRLFWLLRLQPCGLNADKRPRQDFNSTSDWDAVFFSVIFGLFSVCWFCSAVERFGHLNEHGWIFQVLSMCLDRCFFQRRIYQLFFKLCWDSCDWKLFPICWRRKSLKHETNGGNLWRKKQNVHLRASVWPVQRFHCPMLDATCFNPRSWSTFASNKLVFDEVGLFQLFILETANSWMQNAREVPSEKPRLAPRFIRMQDLDNQRLKWGTLPSS